METTLYKNESEDLELHVSICQERYKQLDDRMARVEQDLTEVKQEVKDSNSSLRSTIITTTGTILVAIIAVIGTILSRWVLNAGQEPLPATHTKPHGIKQKFSKTPLKKHC